MVKLFYKIILLSVVLGILGEFFWNSSGQLPHYWGNIHLNTKIEYLKEKNIQPNTYFIGSSITFRQVMPLLFDSIAQVKTQSFNLGADGAFPPQTYLLLDHLMEENDSIKYLFVELSGYDYFAQNFRTTRSKYYLTLPHLSSFYQYIFASSVPLGTKIGISGMYLYSYIEKLLGLGMRKEYVKEITEKNTNIALGVVGRNNTGFYPLGEKTSNIHEKNRLPDFLKILEKDFSKAYESTKIGKPYYNKVFKKQLDHYIALAKTKDIQLIYILNPVKGVFDSPSDIVALFQELPEINKIDLADPSKHPELYLLKYRWDKEHLNTAGSVIYSKKLAESFNTLMK